jgi:hypothetical protein
MEKNRALLFILLLASSCAVQQKYNPDRKFSPRILNEDYQTFRNVLEESHPSLYWYTSKDTMDHYFEWGKSKLKDSLTETQFRNILSYVISRIRCGHTAVRQSKAAAGSSQTGRSRMFPLNVKIWPGGPYGHTDTAVVTSNLNRRDTNVLRGVVLKSIEGKPVDQIVDSFFMHLPADGYNLTHKYQSLSNFGVFRNMYASLFGLKSRFRIEYIDTLGVIQSANINLYTSSADTQRQRPAVASKPPPARERRKLSLRAARSMRMDTALNTAILEINTFTKHNKLRSFFRRSFRKIKEENIQNIVIDMRGNGGGSVTLSNLLTKYIADKPFKIADSLYAISKKSNYPSLIEKHFWNRLFFIFLTRKGNDGNYHFKMYENKYFKPRENNHFYGQVYILTGGNTFSAATLFTKALKDQDDVTVIGEETGGGAYGNTAWLIPDVTLPNTKVRFRLPLFRLVIDKNEVRGRGVIPEIESKPTVSDIRHGVDFKMNQALNLIKKRMTK